MRVVVPLRALRRRSNALAADRRGVSGVEFAILLPMFLVLFFGGFAIAKTIALSRKVTITTRALADLTSQVAAVSSSDLTTIMSASLQILAPFDAAPLGMRISEVTTDATGLLCTVTWSQSSASVTALKANSSFNLPVGLRGFPNVSFIYAETFYTYTPPFGTTIIGPISLGDHIYMLPRTSSSVTYSG